MGISECGWDENGKLVDEPPSLIVHDVFVRVDVVQEPLKGLALQPIDDRKPVLQIADVCPLKLQEIRVKKSSFWY